MRTTTAARGIILALSLLSLLLVPFAQPAQAADSTRERQFVELMNAERTSRGKAALELNAQVISVARSWSDVMGRDSKLKHNPNLADQVTETWSRLGENVGVGPGVDSLHQAFMDSSGHRANVLGDYTQVGVGVTIDGSRIWVTFNFMKGPRSDNTKAAPSGTYWAFGDVSPTSTHGAATNDIAEAGVTQGCGSGRYCPAEFVTRAEMASFLARALDLAPLKTHPFSDVTGGTHAGNIAAIANADITNGCGNGKYCPNDYVTRAAMASFLARALDL